jgi:hypothetical protein
MGLTGAFQVWTGRLCLATVVVLTWAGLYFENVRFAAPAAGFLILAALCYLPLRSAEPSRPLRPSGQRPTL